jgi:flagellar motility protein MotE (MotC chaperone)
MRIVLPVPRLLPATIIAMAALLAVKSVALVRAAVPAPAANAATPTPAAPPAQHAEPDRSQKAGAPPGAAKPPAKPDAAPPSLPARPAEPPISDSERALLLDLRARRTEIEEQASLLTARESAIAAAEHRLGVRLDELSALQRRLEALEAARADRDEANWRGLVRTYESMKPRDAAAIFNDLDLPVLLPVLDRMKEAKAAPVLGAMQPERARQVTAELAQLRLRANLLAKPQAGPAPPEEKR